MYRALNALIIHQHMYRIIPINWVFVTPSLDEASDIVLRGVWFKILTGIWCVLTCVATVTIVSAVLTLAISILEPGFEKACAN